MPILGDLSRAIYRNFHFFYINGVSLSDTMVSGNPNFANSPCISFILVFVVGVFNLKTSGHFVKLSTMTKKNVPLSVRRSQYVDETTVCLS